MKFLDLVKNRKSTRKYSVKPVPRDVIDRCIEAARFAPSACNAQPWEFIVIDDEVLKNRIASKAFANIYSMNKFAKVAPVLIVVVRKQSNYITKLGGFFRGVEYALIDIGIACEHLILQAEEEGVGTCWLGWFNEKEVRKILGLSKRKKIDAMISMGYAEGEVKEKKKKSLEEIRKYNR